MNTPDNWKTTACVHDPERAAFWAEIFGVNVMPIKSIIPSRANLPGHPDARVYLLDLEAITPEQRECLVQGLARRFNLDPEWIAGEIDLQGVPILADQVSVMTTDRIQLSVIFS